MHVEIGAEAALFPEKEYINGIAVAVRFTKVIIMMRVITFCQEFFLFKFIEKGNVVTFTVYIV
jgi:hypothetical protein